MTRSASSHLRILAAFALCVTGFLLALGAVGAVPLPLGESRSDSEKPSANATGAANSRKSSPSSKKNVAPRGGAAKTVAGGRAPATSARNGEDATVRQQRNAQGQTVYSISAARFDISAPLTELATRKIPETQAVQMPELPLPPARILRSDQPDPVTQVAPGAEPRKRVGPAPAAAATGFNFDGVPGSLTGGYPPDTNGSVGNDQYVETVNSRYQVWSLNRATKTVTSLLGPVNINTLWAGFGGACQTQNSGDPIVLYDKVANRWLISQFTSAPASGVFYQCVAISTTPNATGTYARYAFAVPNGDFGDYPHYGVWTDAYYVMSHNFTPAGTSFTFHAASFGAMDRAKMLAGDPSATWQVILDPTEGGHMPADLDGFAPPPGGAPGIFASVHNDGMYLYRMKVDFTTPANTTRTLQAKMPIASASAACGGGNCIPQPNSPVTLDSLADRLMFRLAYRNFIDHESLVVTHSVDPGVASVVSGVRWYEFRLSGQPNAVCSTYPCTYQQGTIADAPNGRSRWMSSIAQDGGENMIVGYSATGTLEPVDAHSIRYTGRAKDHTLGTMTVPETIIFTGTRNEVADNTLGTLPGRWGDYSSMSVDPADDCTFWYANQYYALGSGATNFEWRTRIGSANYSPAQCQPTTCTSRPSSAPVIGTATAIAPNQIQVTWNAVLPPAGSYAIERANGAPGSEGIYQPLGFAPGSATSFIDNSVQGGLTYTYRVIAATDAGARCQALVRSGTASATGTGSCNFKPSFAGAISASSINGPACGIAVTWAPATSNCPLNPTISYNVYRGGVPDFIPTPANRVASCISGPTYIDTQNLTSGQTYYYVVRAEDNSTGHGGACGGNEDANNIHVAGAAYGQAAPSTVGTWTDGGGDATSFLRLNASGTGNTANPTWRIVRSADDAGANHTPGGDYAYRNAGPSASAIYGDNECSSAETPVLTVGATSVNLTYWERHQLEKGWDGVALEFSRNGGPWIDLPAPSNATGDGCMTSDATGDYAPLECTGTPPANACQYPASKSVITGPNNLPAGDCTTYMTADITNYARRCHLITGLTVGDTLQFRWRFTSDPGAEFKGFYLDDIAVTNIRLPSACAIADPNLPTLIGAATRLTHGAAGPFDAPMPLNGSGVEPRLTGGSVMAVLHFDRPIQSANATVSAGTGTAGSVSFSGNDVLVSLTGIINQQRITLTATNLTAVSGGVLPSVSVQIGFLEGDSNGDATVNSGDATVTRDRSGQLTNASNFTSDINRDGVINSGDSTIVRSRSGNGLP